MLWKVWGQSGKASLRKVTFKLWSTWTVGKRIFQAEGTVGKTLEHCAGGVAREQKVGERVRMKGGARGKQVVKMQDLAGQ